MRFDTFMSFIAHQHYRFALVPLGTGEDDELQLFNECKSPVKTLNFGAVRLPAIYSRSKVYTSVVQHRSTGLLVNNSYAEWVDGMRLMYHDGRVREEIGANSREEVRKRHHISAMASSLLGIMQHA
jgi:O-antigen biosynthesis protein